LPPLGGEGRSQPVEEGVVILSFSNLGVRDGRPDVPLDSMGRMLLLFGLVVAAIGLLLILGGRIPFLGQLPGDVQYERDNVRIYVPIATSILVSIVLTLVLNVIFRLFDRS
jgi:hypothetical protein